jgi:hypothetical protein
LTSIVVGNSRFSNRFYFYIFPTSLSAKNHGSCSSSAADGLALGSQLSIRRSSRAAATETGGGGGEVEVEVEADAALEFLELGLWGGDR